MRPILEWYEELPEPYRSQAIENYDPTFSTWTKGIANSHEEALRTGFSWHKTGYFEKWLELWERAKRGEFDDPITKLYQLIAKLEKRQEKRQEQFEKLLR